MTAPRLWEALHQDGGKIVYLVLDGLGGLPSDEHGGTELQVAKTPNFDRLAAESSCGLLEIVGPGITPGSGPGHLALFGYDPEEYLIGRGVLSALGIDFPIEEGDVAARINFATVDESGNVTDRRAGRIATETNQRLCERIRASVKLEGVEFFLETVSEHRAVLVLRGEGLGGKLDDTDPQSAGRPPLEPRGADEASKKTAALVSAFVEQAKSALSDETDSPANFLLLRGFEKYHPLPTLQDRFGLRGVCIADYPMYRGLSRLLGFEVLPPPGGVDACYRTLGTVYGGEGDFFFLHYKDTDKAGEDGDFDAKVRAIEAADRALPHVLAVEPDVLVVTADHSAPATMSAHSWHPVPVLLRARNARRDAVERFDEIACIQGTLGLRPAVHLMGLALAHAGRLKKYGA